jgi:Leucine Rich repeat
VLSGVYRTFCQSQVLVAGPPLGLKLNFLELTDNGFGELGCASLGDALMMGANATLTSLRLDLNPSMGDAGVIRLSRGLRTNGTLTQLSLSYCGIGPDGVAALGEVVRFPSSALVQLDLRGNRMGSEGLRALAEAVHGAPKLETLGLADNGIGGSDAATNAAAMDMLGSALATPVEAGCGLCRVDLQMNLVAVEDAGVLLRHITAENTKCKQLLVDNSLPADIFDALLRVEVVKKKKGKKGGKKK